MKKVKKYSLLLLKQDSAIYWLFSLALFLSLIAGYYFTFIDKLNLVNIDANTRINIARRIFDSLTPGLGQIGAVWPPFPQILMTPLVTSDYLWRSGIAAWIVSGASYIISSLVIYKIVKKLTGSILISFFSACIFLLNINILYLQSTAMSEPFFLMCILFIFYYTLLYIQTSNVGYLISCAIFTTIATLTRFESYSILIGAVIIIFLYLIIHKQKWSKIESTILIYFFPASFGIFLWTIYLWAIFGDPLYWLHYYASIDVGSVAKKSVVVQNATLDQAAITYIKAVININGLISALFGYISFLFVLISKKIELKYKLLIIFPMMLFLFMLLSLSRNTGIIQPQISLHNFLNKPTTIVAEFNLRYGLLMLPYLIIFTSLLLKRFKLLMVIAIPLFLFQTVAYFYTPFNLTHQLRSNIVENTKAPYVSWFKKNYHGGLILISALVHDREMIKLGVPYKQFIYEGTQHYWKESLDWPGKYVTWIIFNRDNPTDPVAKRLKKRNLAEMGFVQRFKDGDLEIYEKQTN